VCVCVLSQGCEVAGRKFGIVTRAPKRMKEVYVRYSGARKKKETEVDPKKGGFYLDSNRCV
jgi:hypothetical protein